MQKTKGGLFASVAATAFMLSYPMAARSQVSEEAATAQSDPQAPEAEIIVVGKRDTDIQTTSASVSVLGHEQLDDVGITNITDLQAIVPSLIVGGNAGTEKPIAVRGISSGLQGQGGDSPVAIYLDGVYIGRPLGSAFEFANIDRIEVLRGPQGTLYGRNVTGGAISITTRRPSAELEAQGLIRYGRYNEILINGAVSGPIAPGLRASFAGTVHRDDGFERRVSDGARRNPIDSRSVNFGVDWDTVPNLLVSLRGDFSAAKIPPDSRSLSDAIPAYGPTKFPLDSNTIFVNEDTVQDVQSGGLGLTLDLTLGDYRLRSISGYRFYSEDRLIDNDQIDFRVQRFSFFLDTKQYTQELNLTNGKGNTLDWLLGAYYLNERSEASYGIQSFLAVPDSPADADTIPENIIVGGRPINTAESWAVFADGTINLTDSLAIGVGARYSTERKTFFRTGGPAIQLSSSPEAINPAPRLVPILVNNPEYDAEDSWDSFTPRVSLEYKFGPRLFGYLSYQKGFKSGGYSFSAGGPISNPSFDPEEITAYEAGIKATWLDGQMQTNISAFKYDYSGLQVALSTEPAVRSIFNAADAKVTGAEIEIQFSPRSIPGFSLSGGLMYLEAEYKDFVINFSGYPTDAGAQAQCPGGTFTPGVRTCDLSGNRLARAPRWAFSLVGKYDIPLGQSMLTPTILYRHEDPIFYTEQNLPEVGHAGIDIIDARLTFRPQGADWSIALWGKNLLDERYVTQSGSGNVRPSFVPGPPFLATGGFPSVGQVSRPRTYGLEISFSF